MKRIIQVGVGGMGRGWTDCVAASKQWEAAAYVDTSKKPLAAAAARHGIPKSLCFTDLKKALKSVEADALLDVTPQQFRKGVCCAAFDQGLHVLSEKPLADNIRNAKAIVARAKQCGRTYMVAQSYRYQPGAQTVKRFVEKGKLGDVGYVGVSFHKGPKFGGFREEMAYPLVLDMSIHHFDLVRCIFGSDVRAVQATSIDAPWNWNKGDATIMAQLELNAGVCVNYFASWVSTGWETSWNADWRIEGSGGVLLWQQDEVAFSTSPERKRKVPMVKMARQYQAYLLEAFGKALDDGIEPETSGRRNLNSLATTYAVVRAAKQKRRVRVSELLK
ncbi:MAG: Gfo/Idh/MocA family oxidoreductase [Nitrospiraceae bacterium]|nr:Gfo/Idh/MocA family oxidoreductase [Nitrospiraceae bacterium]